MALTEANRSCMFTSSCQCLQRKILCILEKIICFGSKANDLHDKCSICLLQENQSTNSYQVPKKCAIPCLCWYQEHLINLCYSSSNPRKQRTEISHINNSFTVIQSQKSLLVLCPQANSFWKAKPPFCESEVMSHAQVGWAGPLASRCNRPRVPLAMLTSTLHPPETADT